MALAPLVLDDLDWAQLTDAARGRLPAPRRLSLTSHHYKLIREEPHPQSCHFVRQALNGSHGRASLPSRVCQAHWSSGRRDLLHLETCLVEQPPPSIPGVKPDVGAVEQATVVRRKPAHQHVQAKVGVAAIGKRGDEPAVRVEQRTQPE